MFNNLKIKMKKLIEAVKQAWHKYRVMRCAYVTHSDWKDDLIWCPSQCYNPIGVTIVGLESTFIFNTDAEAEKAWVDLEKLEGDLELDDLEFTISTDDGHEWTSGVISGYWYGKEDFIDEIADYEKERGELAVYWVNHQ